MTDRRSGDTRADDRRLHARLLAGDRVAPSDLAQRHLDDLATWLMARNPNLHPHDCEEAAADALMALIKRPAAYKPEDRSLAAYLRMAATGDLRNLLRSRGRRRFPATRRKGERFRIVELSTLSGRDRWENSAAGQGEEDDQQDESNPAINVPDDHDIDQRVGGVSSAQALVAEAVLREVRATCSEPEQRVLDLLLINFRQPVGAVAEALGLANAAEDIQRREAKRVLDRLKKRIERSAKKVRE